MSRVNGDHVIVNVDGTPVAHSTSATLNLSQNLIDTTSKDDNAWRTQVAGDREWSIDVEGMVDYSSTFGFEGLNDLIINQNTASVEFIVYDSSSQSTGTKYTGTVNLGESSIEGPHNDAATFSGTFEGTGALSKSAV